MNSPSRILKDTDRFYQLIDKLEIRLDGKKHFSDVKNEEDMDKPGVYLIFEPNEVRRRDPSHMRVTRVGLADRTLGDRFEDHWPSVKKRRVHIKSVLRRHVGRALIAKSNGELAAPTWGVRGLALSEEQLKEERAVEKEVSKYIEDMQVLWLVINDEPSRESMEKNLIRLLSNELKPMDPPSEDWLGRHHPRDRIRDSGLWNIEYVADPCEVGVSNSLEKHV